MVTDAELARINELAHKKKTVGLTEEERIEQAHLREKFLEDFRARFRAQLDNIELVEPDDPRLAEQKKRNQNLTRIYKIAILIIMLEYCPVKSIIL